LAYSIHVKVLFLCTTNSANSIMAESVLALVGKDRFEAHSAGVAPAGRANQQVVEFLQGRKLAVKTGQPKSWHHYTGKQAPRFDYVITLSEDADEFADELPGRPAIAHWRLDDEQIGSADPLVAKQAIRDLYAELTRRIKLFARARVAVRPA
jgi:arsenate reductase